MSVLADIQTALSVLGIPIETGVFTDAAPAKYIVVVPIADTFDLHADNVPGIDVQEARLSIYVQGNYMADKNTIKTAFMLLWMAARFIFPRIGYGGRTGEPLSGQPSPRVQISLPESIR